jgi:hypothetical protein
MIDAPGLALVLGGWILCGTVLLALAGTVYDSSRGSHAHRR